MVSRDTIQAIVRFLDQPLSVEKRKEKNPHMVYPNRSMRRKYSLKKKNQTKRQDADMSSWFERWLVATAGNIQSGHMIRNSYLEEISADQTKAERELYERQLEHFTELYGKVKATKIMNDKRRKDIAIMDKKIGL